MVLSYLLEPNWGKHGLERIALHYLGTTKKPYESVAGKGKKQVTLDKVDIEAVAPYACLDADLTLELGGILRKRSRRPGSTGSIGTSSGRSSTSWPGWRSGASRSTRRP